MVYSSPVFCFSSFTFLVFFIFLLFFLLSLLSYYFFHFRFLCSHFFLFLFFWTSFFAHLPFYSSLTCSFSPLFHLSLLTIALFSLSPLSYHRSCFFFFFCGRRGGYILIHLQANEVLEFDLVPLALNSPNHHYLSCLMYHIALFFCAVREQVVIRNAQSGQRSSYVQNVGFRSSLFGVLLHNDTVDQFAADEIATIHAVRTNGVSESVFGTRCVPIASHTLNPSPPSTEDWIRWEIVGIYSS